MSETQVSGISFVVESSDATRASDSFDKLTSALKSLSSVAAELKSVGGNMQSLASGLRAIVNATNDINPEKFNSLASLRGLTGLIKAGDADSLDSVSQGLERLSHTIDNIDPVKFRSLDGLSGLAGIARNAASADWDKATDGVTGISTAIEDISSNGDNLLTRTVDGMDRVARSISGAMPKTNFAELIPLRYLNTLPHSMEKLNEVSKTLDLSNLFDQLEKLGSVMQNLDASRLNAVAAIVPARSKDLTGVSKALKGSVIQTFADLKATVAENVADISSALATASKTKTYSADLSVKENPLSSLKSSIGGIGTSLSSVLSSVASIGNAFWEWTTPVRDAMAELWKITGIGPAISGMIDSIARSGTLLSPLASTVKDVGQSLKSVMNLDSSKFTLLDKALLGVASAGMAAYRNLLKMISLPVQNLAAKILSLKKHANGFVNAVGRIAIYRAIRSALKNITSGFTEGIKNMYYWSQTADGVLAGSLDRLSTSGQYLRNSLAAMAAPLIQSVAPVVDYLVDKFVALLNIINQVFAVLSGLSSWTKAIKVQKNFADAVGGSGSAAKKAAKDLNNYTTSLDELHIIQDNANSGSGSGGGASAVDYSSMFETQSISESVKQWLATDDWTELGKVFADKINQAMYHIPWEEIESTTQTWATRIYTFFNGSVSGLDWSTVGKTFAYGLNTVLGFFDTVMQGFNWTELGASVATGLYGAITSIDWALVGRSLTNGFRALFETLHGFLDESDKNGFWDTLRQDLTAGIQSAFSNIDFAQAGRDISRLAKEILKTLKAIIDAVPWDDVGEMLKEVDWTGVFKGVLEVIGSIIQGLIESGVGDVVIPAVGAFIGLKVGGLFGPLGAIVGGGIGGLVGVITSRGNEFKSKLKSIVEDGSTSATSLSDTFSRMNEITSSSMGSMTNSIRSIPDSVKYANDESSKIMNDLSDSIATSTERMAKSASTNTSSIASHTSGDFSAAENSASDSVSKLKGSVDSNYDTASAKAAKYSRYLYSQTDSSLRDAYNSARNRSSSINATISSNMRSPSNNSYRWGSDMIGNFDAGVTNTKWSLFKSVTDVASKIRSLFHFTVPDEGPMADADTWMPDMMKLYGEGISGNMDKVVNPVTKLSGNIKSAMQEAMTVQTPNLSMSATVSGDYSVNEDFTVDQKAAMVSALTEVLVPYLQTIDASAARQANKQETTVVTLDRREVTNAVNAQNAANGYKFTR